MKVGILESKKRNLAPAVVEPNLFIGGVASSISNAAALASALNISETNISYFNTNGNDIEAKIEVGYTISNGVAAGITSFKDLERCVAIGNAAFKFINTLKSIHCENVLSIGSQAFQESKCKEFIFPNATQISGGQTFLVNGSTPEQFIYIPRVIQLGDSVGNDNLFRKPKKIYTNTVLETSNSGSPDGDLQYAISLGAYVTYVENFTKPDAIIDLSIDTQNLYATALKLNFTTPNSTNQIDFYEVYLNGIKIINYKAGDNLYLTPLNPGTLYDNINVIVVDEFYNKSEISNSVTGTTSSNYNIPSTDITHYYNMENNANDNVGTANGTPSNVIWENALNGKSAKFNGTANIQLPANILSTNVTEFSFSFLLKTTDTAAEYRVFALNQNTGGPYILVRVNAGGVANKIEFYAYDGAVQSIITEAYNVTDILHIQGTLVEDDKIEFFINGDKIGEKAIGTFTQVSANGNYIGAARNGTVKAKALIDGVALYNKKLKLFEAYEIAQKQLNGQELI